MLNKVLIIGRVGRDPEIRYTGSGKAVANFSIATSESYKDRNGEKQEKTEWYKIVAWEKLAEIIGQYVVKGQLLYIEGKGQTREWENKEGQKQKSFEVVAQQMKMLSRGKESGASADTAPREEAPGGATGPDINDEDIPF